MGIESSTGGQFSPIFQNKSFVYIPIPDYTRDYFNEGAHSQMQPARQRQLFKQFLDPLATPSYREIPAIRSDGQNLKKSMADFLTDATWSAYIFDYFTYQYLEKKYAAPLPEWIPHFDPEFDTFTYGEGSHNKAKTLTGLTTGDLLIFYGSLVPVHHNGPVKKYILGYFVIDQIFNYKPSCGGTSIDYTHIPELITHNSHIRYFDPVPVVAVGNPQRSKQLQTAIPLTDSKFEVYPELADFLPWDFGTHTITRGIRKFETTGHVENWLKLLEGEGPKEIYLKPID